MKLREAVAIRPLRSNTLDHDVRENLTLAAQAVHGMRLAVDVLAQAPKFRDSETGLLTVQRSAEHITAVVGALGMFLSRSTVLLDGDVAAIRRFGATAGTMARRITHLEGAYANAARAEYREAGYLEVIPAERGWPESSPVGVAKSLAHRADGEGRPAFAFIEGRVMVALPGTYETRDARAQAALEAFERLPHGIGSTLENGVQRAARVVELTEAQRVAPRPIDGKVTGPLLAGYLHFAEIDAAAAALLKDAPHQSHYTTPADILESKRTTAAGIVDAHAPDDLRHVWLERLRVHTDAAKRAA